jgi:hypothetical protein
LGVLQIVFNSSPFFMEGGSHFSYM